MSGAFVKYCNHNGGFVADIYKIAGAVVVRANGPLSPATIDRSGKRPYDFQVSDYPKTGFWRPDLGVFVIPRNQLKKVTQNV